VLNRDGTWQNVTTSRARFSPAALQNPVPCHTRAKISPSLPVIPLPRAIWLSGLSSYWPSVPPPIPSDYFYGTFPLLLVLMFPYSSMTPNSHHLQGAGRPHNRPHCLLLLLLLTLQTCSKSVQSSSSYLDHEQNCTHGNPSTPMSKAITQSAITASELSRA